MHDCKNIQQLLSSNEDFRRQRHRLYIALFLQRFIDGVQYGIILPSAWQYLRLFSAEPWFFGIVMSVCQVSGMMALLYLGKLYDRTKRIREILLITNIFSIVGSLTYSLPFSPWFLFFGRFLSGVGSGFRVVADAELTMITAEKQKLVFMARLGFGGFFGLLLGPILALLFKVVNFQLGVWRIDYRNAPGVFAAILWILMQIVTLALVTNVAKDFVIIDEMEKDGEILLNQNDSDTNNQEDDEESVSTDTPEDFTENETITETFNSQISHHAAKIREAIIELGSFEIMGILISNFLIWVYVLAPETLMPLLTQNDFGWSPVYTSIMYVAVAIEAAALYILLQSFRANISDFIYIPLSIGVTWIGSTLWIVYQMRRHMESDVIPIFVITIVTSVASYPIFHVGAKSLLSKVTSIEVQGLVQSSMFLSGQVAGIVAPLWGSFMYQHLYAASSVTLVMDVMCLVWFLLSCKRLKERALKYGESPVKKSVEIVVEEQKY